MRNKPTSDHSAYWNCMQGAGTNPRKQSNCWDKYLKHLGAGLLPGSMSVMAQAQIPKPAKPIDKYPAIYSSEQEHVKAGSNSVLNKSYSVVAPNVVPGATRVTVKQKGGQGVPIRRGSTHQGQIAQANALHFSTYQAEKALKKAKSKSSNSK